MSTIWIRFIASLAFASALFGQAEVQVPEIWDDARLADWSTPLAALNVRPGHFSSEEYYLVPADNLRTYPVYPPDREPPGYWEWLQSQKPEPLVDVAQVRTKDDWIAAGRRAFFELDVVRARTSDPATIARARDPESFKGVYTLADGSVLDPRWVVTDEGLMLTMSDCTNCHMRVRQGSDPLFGGPLAHGRRKCRSRGRQACPYTNFSTVHFHDCFSRSHSAWRSGEPRRLRGCRMSAWITCAR
jgi:hypothetical protein